MTVRSQGDSEVVAVLHRFATLLGAHDPAITREFAEDADVLLVGSEADEIARGPDGIAAFFDRLVHAPVTIVFEWHETQASVLADAAWLFARGHALVRSEDGGERRSPYRLTGVLVRREGRWLWKHFHGSEPTS